MGKRTSAALAPARHAINGSKQSMKRSTTTNRHAEGRMVTKTMRGQYDVVLEDEQSKPLPAPPHCLHGPCLLFQRRDGTMFYACAVYRGKQCSFHRPCSPGKVARSSAAVLSNEQQSPSHATLRKRFVHVAKDPATASFCRSCSCLVSAEDNKHPAGAQHDVILGLTKRQLLRPTELLAPVTDSDGEAQYWFDVSTLNIIINVIATGQYDGVLCVGAPKVFEEVRAAKTAECFLLDFDHRFAHFIKPAQFAQYSMLTDHVFSAGGQSHLTAFLSQCTSLLIVADPPFGVMVSPFLQTLKRIRERHCSATAATIPDASAHCIIALPRFFERRVLAFTDGRVKLTDFKVAYSNHGKFTAARASPIRFFTDIAAELFVLPLELGYRFCAECKRYVAKDNEHCKLCNKCPSVTGQTYQHCDLCKKCVKPSYAHCLKCRRCHLKGNCRKIDSG